MPGGAADLGAGAEKSRRNLGGQKKIPVPSNESRRNQALNACEGQVINGHRFDHVSRINGDPE